MTDLPECAVLDGHAHLFSRRFFASLAEQASCSVEDITKHTGVEAPGEDSSELADRWVEEMDRHGVQRMVLIASIPGDQNTTLGAAERHPARLIPYAMFQPRAPRAFQELEQASEQGLRGVCLFPAMHHFHLDDDDIHEFIEIAAQSGLLVFAHFGLLRLGLRDKLGLKSPFDLRFSNPISLGRAAHAFPDTSFVIPHLGCGFFREALMMARQCPNVLLDTSSSNSWIEVQPGRPSLDDVLSQALDALGPNRLVFGSDSGVFPRGYRSDLLAAQLTAFRDLGVSREDEAMIFGGNLTQALNLEG